MSALLVRVTEHALSFPFAILFEYRPQEFYSSNALPIDADSTSDFINIWSVP
jgi:hypothetical protein